MWILVEFLQEKVPLWTQSDHGNLNIIQSAICCFENDLDILIKVPNNFCRLKVFKFGRNCGPTNAESYFGRGFFIYRAG